MRHVKTILTTLNQITIAIVWGAVIILGILATLSVITVMSIIWSISMTAGLGFLGFILLVVWMMFYSLKH
jgi:hypothetical protein